LVDWLGGWFIGELIVEWIGSWMHEHADWFDGLIDAWMHR
jgi:hypothetical protein